jgi:hypothetical protein
MRLTEEQKKALRGVVIEAKAKTKHPADGYDLSISVPLNVATTIASDDGKLPPIRDIAEVVWDYLVNVVGERDFLQHFEDDFKKAEIVDTRPM